MQVKRTLAVIALAGLAGCAANAGQLGNRASSVITDSYLYAAVRAKLVGVDADSATNVHVSVDRGVVTLTGQAHTSTERSRYVLAAASISGVKHVRDLLGVNPHLRGIGDQTRDAALAVRVSAAIAGQAGTNVFHVSPEVRNGIVTLRGTVPTLAVERTVVRTTQGVPGVRRVVNDLVIRR